MTHLTAKVTTKLGSNPFLNPKILHFLLLRGGSERMNEWYDVLPFPDIRIGSYPIWHAASIEATRMIPTLLLPVYCKIFCVNYTYILSSVGMPFKIQT